MKYLIYAIIFIASSFLFLPAPGTTEIRNVPILIVIHIFVFARIVIKVTKRVSLAVKTRSALKQNGFDIEKAGLYGITAKKDGVTYNVKLMVRKKAHLSYYFKDENTLEFYKTNRVVMNSIKAKGAVPTKHTETKRDGLRKKLKWAKSVENVLVINKFPVYVNDSIKKEPLGNGDKICGKISIYDYAAFCDFAKK